MTNELRFERQLPALLEDLYLGSSPDYRNDVLAAATAQRQRPAWTFPGRWLPMDITTRAIPMARLPWRQLGVLALIALLLAAALAVAVGSQRHLPAPFGPARNGLIPYISNGDLYVGDPKTGATRLLVGDPENVAVPQFSPDGTRVAFLRTAHAAGADPVDVYVVSADGSDLKRITPEPLADWRSLTWTPDGRQLAVIHPVESSGCGTTICFVNQLDFFDATGSGAIQHIASADGMDFIRYRPPLGDTIVYRALVNRKWGLFAMDPDGSNRRTLAQPTVPSGIDLSFGGATYSADGSRIFYQHGDDGGCCQLWVMNADGTGARGVLPCSALPGMVKPSRRPTARGSPTGTTATTVGGKAVVSRRADGTGPVIETGPDARHGEGPLGAGPDLPKILMFSDGGSSTSAYLLDPEGGPATTVPWGSNGDLDWQRLAPPD